jgi:hypothetical protein
MCYHGRMIDFPIAEFMDESILLSGWNVICTSMGGHARAVGTMHGVCSVHKTTFQHTAVGSAMITIPC